MEPGEEVLRLDGVSLGAAKLDAIELSVRAHEIVGIAGVAGNGQADLANVISGLARPDS
ncbi:MAG: ABC transporter ATP-binding protein, partial [Deltaproteobacteria bacterium]|nr:ABC transporter ATP-binding protein [Deltaproteobacteria bacterium]